MSIDELHTDHDALTDRIANLLLKPDVNLKDVLLFMKNDLVPLQGSIIEEMGEMDDALEEMYERSEDTLTRESAGILAVPLALGAELAAELERRLGPADTAWAQRIQLFRSAVETAGALMEQITVDVNADAAAGDQDEEDDDEDGGK